MKAFIFKSKYVFVALLFLTLFSSYFFFSCKEEYDHTVDTANPTIVSYNPVSGIEDVSLTSNLVLTFDEYIQIGEGNITIASETDTQIIDVTSDAVTIGDDERILTIDPEDLSSNKEYTVTLDQGIVTDLVGNIYMGMDDGDEWTFTTRKETSLSVTAFSPENGSTDGSLFKFSMTFSAAVEKGDEGSIIIYNSDDEVVAELSISSQYIVVEDNIVSFSLTTLLDFSTSYYINVDAGAILDTDGNEFEGISDKTSWSFTTTSGTASYLIVHLPLDDDLSDDSGDQFDATLGENATDEIEFVTDAVRGEVAYFNAGSYAVLPKHDYLRPSATQDFSVNVWVKFAGIGSDPVLWGNKDWDSGSNPGILLCTSGGDTYDAADETSSGNGWIINMNGDSDNSTRVDWKAAKAATRAPSISDNEWHMVTVVVDRTNQVLKIYLDGTEYSYETATSLSGLDGPLYDQTNDYPFTLWEDGTGGYNAGSDTRKELEGMMDDFRIYGKALAADEVSSLYNE